MSMKGMGMKAVGIIEFGGPEALEVVELPEPHVWTGEVRIRVHAAAVSPTDTMFRSGDRADLLRKAGPPPYIPGMDLAGVIEEIGEGVNTDLAVGDHVMTMVRPGPSRGAYAEKIVVPVESVARTPVGASDVEASTLPMNGLTARLALDTLALKPGQTIAVTGAAGAFGGYVVELAKADGLIVVADSSEADEKLVKALGADIVVPRGDGFPPRVRQQFPEGVDGAVDGSVQGALVAGAVRDGGTVITVRGYGDPGERGVTFKPIVVVEYLNDGDKLDGLRQLAEQGKITLRVAGTFPKESAAEAHRLLEAGGTRGRFVIEF